MKPQFIDFEASSLDLISSYPIEVGLSLADGSVRSWLIRPAPLWNDWSESAQAIHGISRDQLQEEGHDAVVLAKELNSLIDDVVYCDAWTHDSFWLHRLFKAARIKPAFQVESVVHLLSDREINLWAKVRRRVIEETGLHTHRAGNDVRILLETWARIRKDSED